MGVSESPEDSVSGGPHSCAACFCHTGKRRTGSVRRSWQCGLADGLPRSALWRAPGCGPWGLAPAGGSRGNLRSSAVRRGAGPAAGDGEPQDRFPLGPGLDRSYLCIGIWIGMSEQSVFNLRRLEFCYLKELHTLKASAESTVYFILGLKFEHLIAFYK